MAELIIEVVVTEQRWYDSLRGSGVGDIDNGTRSGTGHHRGKRNWIWGAGAHPVAHFFEPAPHRKESQLRVPVIRVDRGFGIRHVDHAHADGGHQKQRHEDDEPDHAFFVTATFPIPKLPFPHPQDILLSYSPRIMIPH